MNKINNRFLEMILSLNFSFLVISCSTSNIMEIKLAEDAYKEGRYLTAITYASETLTKDPSNYQAKMIKGKSNLKLNNYTDAITDFTNVLKLDENFEPYYYRSRAYLEINELEKAAIDLKKAIYYNPKNVEALFDYAYVETLLDNYEPALDAYNQVIKIDPKNSNAYVNIGDLKGRMGESESAIEYFSKAISIKPNDALAYFNRATEKLIINDKQEAIEDISVSVSIDSNNINSYFLLAETRIQIKDYKNAIKNLNKIILLDPQSARAYYLKGISELAINDNEKACTDLRKAGELGYYDAYELITKNCLKKEKTKTKR